MQNWSDRFRFSNFFRLLVHHTSQTGIGFSMLYDLDDFASAMPSPTNPPSASVAPPTTAIPISPSFSILFLMIVSKSCACRLPATNQVTILNNISSFVQDVHKLMDFLKTQGKSKQLNPGFATTSPTLSPKKIRSKIGRNSTLKYLKGDPELPRFKIWNIRKYVYNFENSKIGYNF